MISQHDIGLLGLDDFLSVGTVPIRQDLFDRPATLRTSYIGVGLQQEPVTRPRFRIGGVLIPVAVFASKEFGDSDGSHRRRPFHN
jgi:hypothetical protein